ncbi:MAG: type II toxin-antitoxin system RelE/ParE family toxin [Bacteroidales bacterium]|nr:type II toxin-antitoxin system RelE/ParE family toxin [Bacteroidales bacterium]MCF8336510.1 type II toxin-antitoxin system RelE/ParE family toxin [Bacteroidales bacterium]
MAVKLVWTKRAIQGYDRIVKHLYEEWTEKEVKNFVQETAHFFELLKENPKMLEPTGKNKNLYRGPINRLTILTYRYKPRKKEIILVNVRETRRKPLK